MVRAWPPRRPWPLDAHHTRGGVARDLAKVAQVAHALIEADRHAQLFGQRRVIYDVARGERLLDGAERRDARHLCDLSSTSASLEAEQLKSSSTGTPSSRAARAPRRRGCPGRSWPAPERRPPPILTARRAQAGTPLPAWGVEPPRPERQSVQARSAQLAVEHAISTSATATALARRAPRSVRAWSTTAPNSRTKAAQTWNRHPSEFFDHLVDAGVTVQGRRLGAPLRIRYTVVLNAQEEPRSNTVTLVGCDHRTAQHGSVRQRVTSSSPR